ncbi:MAG TPA: AI-2E family transporter [Longimicrobium sp.]|nr:AI-2E family transporter [Longimicrobium sp.]
MKQPSHPIHTPAPGANKHFDWQIVHSVIVVVVLGIFLYTVRGILSPFLVFLLLLFVTAPLQGTRIYVLVVSAAAMLTLIWALNATGFLLAPFLLALAFSYIQNPLVTRMERRKIPRKWGTLIMAIPTLVILGLLFFVGLPALGGQIADFINNSPQYLQRATVWVEGLQAQVMRRDIPGVDEEALVARLRAIQPEQMVAYLQQRQSAIARAAWAGVLGLGRGVGTILSILSYIFLTPILTYYLLRDWPNITARLGEMVPVKRRPAVLAFAREYDRLLSGFLRGNVTSSAVVGFLTFLGLFLLGFPYAVLLGIMAAVFNIIPYVGLILTLIPALVIALFTPDPVVGLGKALGVFVVVQLLDGAVLSPNIVGESVNLHPVWVILALSVFGFFFGFVGLLLAVPLAVLLKLVITHALVRYRRSRLYLGDESAIPLS